MFEIKQVKIKASENFKNGSNSQLMLNNWVKTALDAKEDLDNGYSTSEVLDSKNSRFLQVSPCISSNIVMKMKG